MKKTKYIAPAISVVFFLLLFITGYSQSQDENYVMTTTYKDEAGSPSSADISITYYDGIGRPVQQIAHKQSGSGGDLIMHIEYDGFGRQTKEFLPYERTMASLNIDGSADSNVYSFYSNPLYGNTAYPYSEKELENTVLGRVLRQAAPGDDWAMDNPNNSEIGFDYRTNSSNEVYYFTVNNPDGTPALALNTGNNGRYPENQLYKSVMQDENHPKNSDLRGTVVEFKDKQGRVILRRHYGSSSGYRGEDPDPVEPYDTYYVYDSYGNLTFVLPPLLSEQIVSGGSLVSNHNDLIDELGYRYKYDYRNRLITKKLPGKRYEFIAYDPLDRVVAVGPVKSPFEGQDTDGVLHTRYDHFNRLVYTYWVEGYFDQTKRQDIEDSITSVVSESPLETPETDEAGPVYYTRDVAAQPNRIYLTQFAYHYYPANWVSSGEIVSGVLGQTVHYNNTTLAKGLPTVIWTRVLEDISSTHANITFTLYDVKGRPLRVKAKNHLGGYTQTDSQYNNTIDSKVIKTETKHKRTSSDTEITTTEEFTYTHGNRLEKHTHKINSLPVQMLSFNQYDALGRLITKKVGDASESQFLQQVDYKYNVRGWLTDINNISNLAESGQPQDLFAFKIGYNTLTQAHAEVEPLYNGNIAQTFWRTANDNIKRSYGYVYDFQNRLRDAYYKIPYSSVNDSYNEHLSYDSNGNILQLTRFGIEEDDTMVYAIDDLLYEYDTGNKLINVQDLTNYTEGFNDGNKKGVNGNTDDDFEYDLYGNLIKDRNKDIAGITYNHLNLPKKIVFENDDEIEYLYDATGVKLRKKVKTGVITRTTHYTDGFQYSEDKMDFFPTAEGYVNVTWASGSLGSPPVPTYNYVYNYTDHLGNIRLRYTKNPGITGGLRILEEDHYYPFGLKHQGYNSEHEIFEFDEDISTVVLNPVNPLTGDKYKYKFNGMEWQNELDLNYYDFGMRNYDAALGRWMNIDPLAEVSRRWSPYTYAYNNPVFFIDPDGMMANLSLNANTQATIGQNSFVVTTFGHDGSTLDSQIVSSLEGVGYDLDGKIFTDGGASQVDGDDPIPPGYSGKAQTAPATPIQINGVYNPNAYNCHSYAWTNSQGDPNDPANAYPMSVGLTRWDNDPTNNTQGYTALNFNDPNQIGDRLIYYAWDSASNSVIATHSAVVTGIDAQGLVTEVESKWGQGPQYTHHPRDIPPSYGSTNPTFVAPNGQVYPSRIYYRQNP